jgi:hypothetical protein
MITRRYEIFRIELLETRLTVMSVQSVIPKEAFPVREC